MFRKMLAAILLCAAVPSHAAWKVANSKHFTVYNEGGEADARATAELLEKYLIVLRAMTGTKMDDSPVKPVIYMMAGQSGVSNALPYGGGEGVAGFYNAGIRGPYAVMSRREQNSAVDRSAASRDTSMKSQHVLLHEITHHFMLQYFPAAYPTWYIEGFAEYMGSAAFRPNNVVEIGAPVGNRYLIFKHLPWLPMRTVMRARNYGEANGSVLQLYSQGWLLVHYLTNTKNRPGQLAQYLKDINAGKPFGDAAASAFGNLDKLDDELQAYAARGELSVLSLPFKSLDAGEISVRPMTAAETAMLPFELSLKVGVPQAKVGNFADDAARAAAPHADDPYALAVLADAQRLAGRNADAQKTADLWLAKAPTDGRAMAFRAILTTDALAAAKSSDAAAWSAVRQQLVAANKRAPDQPRTLQAYFRSFTRAGTAPPVAAQNALIRAFELLPQDDELRVELAAELERDNAVDEAITVIKPLAVTIRDPATMSAGRRAEREADRARYKLAGSFDESSVPAMLARLEKKAASTTTAAK